MNRVRRPLGLGPATSPTTPSDSPVRGLLPVERVVGDSLVDVVGEDQAVVQPRGRRVLGSGFPGAQGVLQGSSRPIPAPLTTWPDLRVDRADGKPGGNLWSQLTGKS